MENLEKPQHTHHSIILNYDNTLTKKASKPNQLAAGEEVRNSSSPSNIPHTQLLPNEGKNYIQVRMQTVKFQSDQTSKIIILILHLYSLNFFL